MVRNHLLNAFNYCSHHQNSNYKNRAGLQSKLKICSVEMLSPKPAVGHGKILFFFKCKYCSFTKCHFCFVFKGIIYKKHERFISICLHLLKSPSGTSGWAAPAAAVLNHPSLWNCRTDLGIKNTIPAMVKCHHSGTEDSTSPGGTMDFTGKWERRFKNKQTTKKKILWKRLT